MPRAPALVRPSLAGGFGRLTEEGHLLRDAVDVDDGPERGAHVQATVEEHWVALVDAVEDPAVPVGPECQHVVPECQPLGQCLGPVAGPRHQVRAGVLGDVGGGQLAGVQAGEAEAERATPAAVHARQTQAYLLVEAHWTLAKGDAVAEAALACCPPQLRVQPDVLALGVRVEARRLDAEAERRR